MQLQVTTHGALTAGEPWSAEAIAARRARGSARFPPTPQDLLSRAQHADADAVSALFRRYADAIRSFLRSRGALEHEAPDMTQGTLLGMWRSLGLFRREKSGSFHGWLCTIAMRQLLTVRRKQAKLQRLQESSAQVELERQLTASQAQCGEREARRQRALEIIERVWQRLAEQYREAGEQVAFDYLRESIYTGTTARDVELSRELGHSDGYLAKRRHDLRKVEYPKALRAEFRDRRPAKPLGHTPPCSFKEWTGALLDDLA
jgi:RNA polymerase sigma factor (sigma-70 family)